MSNPITQTGFCLSGNHDRCPHVMRYSMGVWVQRICTCKCHPATAETDIKREGTE